MVCSAVLMVSPSDETSVTVLVVTPRKNSLSEVLEPHAVPSSLVFPLGLLVKDRQLGLEKKFSFQLEASLFQIFLHGGMNRADEWHRWYAGLMLIVQMLHW